MAIESPCKRNDETGRCRCRRVRKRKRHQLSVLDATAASTRLQLPVLLGAVAQRLLLTGTRRQDNGKAPLYTPLSHAPSAVTSHAGSKLERNSSVLTPSHLDRIPMPELGSPPPERCTLTVKQLKRVVNDRPILQDLSFAITTGEVLFVRGPSGVGKSLLLRCLAHLDPIQVRVLT